AVDAQLPARAGAAHPRPLIRAGIVFPQIVEGGGGGSGRIPAVPAEEPQVAAAVDPADRALASAGGVGRRRDALGAVDAGDAGRVAAAHPGPPVARDVVLPQIVEIAEVDARPPEAAEDPQVSAGAVEPADRL